MSSPASAASHAKERRKEYKKGIDSDESRRKREETTIEIRKSKREEQLAKRRLNPQGQLVSGSRQNVMRDPQTEEKLKMIPVLTTGIMSEDPQTQYDCTVQFRKILSIEQSPPIQEVLEAGVLPKLVQFLTFSHHPKLQFEAAWAITNIASGDSSQTQIVIESGAVQLFVQLLKSQHTDVREQAVWALGNIAGDSWQFRDIVLKRGALPPLLALCDVNNPKTSLVRNATWTLSNFCRGKPQPPWDLVKLALPVLARLAYSTDDEVLTDACWALSYLSDDSGPYNDKIQAVIETGVVRRLVDLLMHKKISVVTPALRTVGNIVTGDDNQTQAVLNVRVLPNLGALLHSTKPGIRKEACWAISNITAGSAQQIQAVIEANLVPPLVQVLSYSPYDIKKEAAWSLSNATAGGTDEQIRYLVDCGIIAPLCDLFTVDEARIVIVALEGIDNILRVGAKAAALAPNGENHYAVLVEQCKGLAYMEDLERHENPEVAEKAQKILTAYFDAVEEVQDVSIEPSVQGNQFAFGQSNSKPDSDQFHFG